MELNRKRLFSFTLMGIVAFSILFNPVCFTLCSASLDGTDVYHGASCTFSSHFFTQIAIVLSAIFILPFMGLLFVISSYYIPSGFLLSPFKPPRFHT